MLKENQMSARDIAKSVGMHESTLYGLMSGDDQSGPIGQLFHSEYDKVKKAVEERTQQKITEVRDSLVDKLKKWVATVSTDDMTSSMKHRQMVDALNALSRALPMVNVSTNIYQTNLSAEDLINEFKHLTSVARASAIRGRVSTAIEGGAGEVSLSPEGPHSQEQGQ
jgi:predicted AAA+ superfamily ATPase